jgi:hypothetical protein
MSEKAMRTSEDVWDRTPPQERYHVDPMFHAIVDVLYAHMRDAKYTPTELREACHLAACMYEERNVRPLFIDPKRPFVWNVKP